MSVLVRQPGAPRRYTFVHRGGNSTFDVLAGRGVLLFSALDTFEEPRIAEHLSAIGVPTAILPLPLAPEMVRLDLGAGARLWVGEDAIPLNRVGAVWSLSGMERPQPAGTRPELHAFDLEEWRAALALLAAELKVPWTNHPAHASLSRLGVLRVARQLGFCTPRTLVTNDPQRARRFVDALRGRCVVKRVGHAFPELPDGTVLLTPVRRVEEADLEADALRACPVLLQQEVPKGREFRCYVVGGEVLSFQVHAPATVDWRTSGPAELSFEQVDVGELTRERLLALSRLFGLSYAAADLIEDLPGRLHLLEVNPNGVHQFCQIGSGPSLDERIARHLASQAGR